MTHLQNLSYHQNSNCHSKLRGSPRTRTSTSTETSGRNCVCVIQIAMDDRMREVYNYLSDKNYPPSYSKLQKLTLRRYASKFSIQNGELYYSAKRTARKVVMTRERGRELFQEFHCSPMGGHSGVFKTRNALSSRFYWPGMMIDILKWVAECDRCQKIGKPLVVDSTLQSIQVSTVWELVGIDLTGPLPQTADGYQYILTATDYFTKWVEAFPLKTKTAKEVAKCLCTIVYRHGCPLRILSDQGREFVNEVNNSICSLMSIKHSVTAAYHPQTNGLDEKTNHNIKRALAKLVNDHQNDWNIYLDAILFSLRSKVHTSTKFSPFFLMYGREARFPSEVPEELPLSTVILPDASTYDEAKKTRTATSEEAHVKAKINTSKSQQKQKEVYAKRMHKKYKDVVYSVGNQVLLYNARKKGRKGGRLEADFSGPYTIESLLGKLVTLRNLQGDILKTKYNVNHIKPYMTIKVAEQPVGMSPVTSASPVLQQRDEFQVLTDTRAEICSSPLTSSSTVMVQSEAVRPSVIVKNYSPHANLTCENLTKSGSVSSKKTGNPQLKMWFQPGQENY